VKHAVSPDVTGSSFALRRESRGIPARIQIPQRTIELKTLVTQELRAAHKQPEAFCRALEVYRRNMDAIAPSEEHTVEMYV